MTKPKILQLDASGNPSCWITYVKAAYYYCKESIAWTAGENEITLNGGINRITGIQTKFAMNSIIAVSGKVRTSFRAPPVTNEVLFRRDYNMCVYCGHKYPDNLLTREHIIPKGKGGRNTWMNCITACKPCNNYKGDRSLEQLGLVLKYQPYTPNRAEVLLYSNARLIEDQKRFLLKCCPENSRALTRG
jgi:hypothetical protein